MKEYVPSDGVDWESGDESGHRARVGRDIETKCLSRLEPGLPIHLYCPDLLRLTVRYVISCTVAFKKKILHLSKNIASGIETVARNNSDHIHLL